MRLKDKVAIVTGAGSGFGGFGISRVETPASTALAGADVSTSESVAGLLDFQQTLPFGLRYDVSYNVGRTDTNSVFQSFRRWAKKGVFELLFEVLSGEPDFEYALIDGTIVSVHQKASGARGGLKIRLSGGREAV